MRNTNEVWERVDAKKGAFIDLSDRVWHTPELLYDEYRSAAAHEAALRAEGFRVETNLAGIPTALMGEAGEGGPVIAILGEYDALPGLSQEAGVAEPRPVPGESNGHGCGHNLLGAGAMLAATALKDHLAERGLAGRVRYYGCPAEEGGAAKAFMVRAGCFDDVDIAITWHPSSFDRVAPARALANTRVDFVFRGRASHASGAPELGRSALDAVELMSVGVNYMREHMPPDARVHYALIDAGGIAPNVVQANATVRYAVRAGDRTEMLALVERVKRIAAGAALMSETQTETRVLSAVSNLLANTPLEHAMYEEFQSLGPTAFDDADRDFARAIQATLSPADTRTAFKRVGLPFVADKPLCDAVVPLGDEGPAGLGSTDVADVSWVVPTVQAHCATMAIGTPGHSWQLTAQGKSPAAHKGMVTAAKIMAATALRGFTDRTLIDAAKADLQRRTAETPYASPIPADVEPPLNMSRLDG